MKAVPGVKEAYLAVGKSHLCQQIANGEDMSLALLSLFQGVSTCVHALRG